MIRAAIIGASGYAGGELLRLLLGHPQVTVAQVTSRRYAGRHVGSVHPNLRGRTALKFRPPEALERCDVLFLALPHGAAAAEIERYAGLAERVVDLSADFRLRDPAAHARWYGETPGENGWRARFEYGLPEVNRERLRGARLVSGVGCNATAVTLALLPLARAGLIDCAVADLKVGSSEGGQRPGPATHHPERSGALRTFAPTGHRHAAEVHQALGDFDLHLTATAVEMVRGVLCTAHVFLRRPVDEARLWQVYRAVYAAEPFIRLVRERRGLYRTPEPKILAGSNYCDVGLAVEEGTRRVVVMSALDNLMKGAAGTAVQALNVMFDWPETLGLEFAGLHPV